MRVLVLGSGAREHSLCWAISRDLPPGSIHCAPGNAGTASFATSTPLDPADPAAVLACVEHAGIDLTVIGPELPLTTGVANHLGAAGHLVCGPTHAAAELESSKVFAKDLLARHGIPTADHVAVSSLDDALSTLRSGRFGLPVVLKADGLAAGKGVVIAESLAVAEQAARDMMETRRFGAAGDRLVIETCMTGREASFFVLTDGTHARVLPTAEDHKRAFDHDKGPNTGGMGAFAPSPLVDAALADHVLEAIVFPTLHAMRAEGRPFAGFLYAGLMLTPDGPKVVEFNARLGDPETQVVLPALAEPLLPHIEAAARGHLESGVFRTVPDKFVGVVLASGGYPDTYRTGLPIAGLDAAASEPDVLVFHAGTTYRDGSVVTAGGRVLTVVGRGVDYAQARNRAYAAVAHIHFDGAFCRSDIGVKAMTS